MAPRDSSSTAAATGRDGALPAPYAARQIRLRGVLRERGLDALLITNPNDIRYLSPFSGEDSYALVTARRFFVISDGRFAEELKPLRRWAEIVIRTGGIAERAGELVRDLKLATVGVQADRITVATRKALARIVGAGMLKDTVGLMLELRAVKDAVEVSLIRKALEVQQEAMRATLATLEAGQTEMEIAARLDFEMKSRGAEATSFQTNVSARDNGCKPHYRPSAKVKLAKNHPLLIDWGARVDGYCADLTRAWSIGRMSPRMREIYRVVLDAQLAGIAAIRPGARCRDVDAAARKIIADAGYGDCYTHGLGHGIGLDVHEMPSLSHRVAPDATLKPGHVVTVEPGIYLSGVGGVRIEDDVLVTQRGCEVLSDFPKDLESVVL